MGKRVVFLKQLSSGLLMVTGERGVCMWGMWLMVHASISIGPFCVNGVPLRRVNQAYVIATKTRVDISKVQIPARLNDDYFRRSKPKTKAGSGNIFAESKQVSTVTCFCKLVSGLCSSVPRATL